MKMVGAGLAFLPELHAEHHGKTASIGPTSTVVSRGKRALGLTGAGPSYTESPRSMTTRERADKDSAFSRTRDSHASETRGTEPTPTRVHCAVKHTSTESTYTKSWHDMRTLKQTSRTSTSTQVSRDSIALPDTLATLRPSGTSSPDTLATLRRTEEELRARLRVAKLRIKNVLQVELAQLSERDASEFVAKRFEATVGFVCVSLSIFLSLTYMFLYGFYVCVIL